MPLRLVFIFLAYYLAALLLLVYPFSPAVLLINPPWLCLVVLYFTLCTSLSIGMASAALIGFCADILIGVHWGTNSIPLVIVFYLFSFFCDRVRHHPVWQQAMWIGMFAHVYLLAVNWMEGLAGYGIDYSTIIIKTCMAILIWPCLFALSNKVLRSYRLQ